MVLDGHKGEKLSAVGVAGKNKVNAGGCLCGMVLGLDGFHMFCKSLPVEGGSGMGIGKDSDPEISHF